MSAVFSSSRVNEWVSVYAVCMCSNKRDGERVIDNLQWVRCTDICTNKAIESLSAIGIFTRDASNSHPHLQLAPACHNNKILTNKIEF